MSILASALLLLPFASALAPEDDASVKWKKKSYLPSELPAETGPTAGLTAHAWSDWVIEHDYQMHLSDDARVLVISRRKNSAITRQLKLIDKTAKFFDKLLPTPERLEAQVPKKDYGADAPPGNGEEGELPEDPESGPAGWEDESEAGEQTSWSYEWGATTFELDTETCLIFVANDMEDYASILDRLAESHDYLKPWLETGKRLTGFVLERPLAAAYVENVGGQEEWDPKNELVNRTAQLLFLRRFSQLPYWLVQGFAWHAEFELLGGLYCFPYRSEFVFATEHTGWPAELKKRFKKKDPRVVEMSEFVDWRRGKFLPDHARVSFGLVSFLAKHHTEALSNFSERLRVFWDEDNRTDTGPGSWSRQPGYEISASDQERLLREFFNEDVLSEAGRALAEGKSYRPKRK